MARRLDQADEERAMGDKSPAKTDKKKAAKTLMEKRGDKKAKKADKKFL